MLKFYVIFPKYAIQNKTNHSLFSVIVYSNIWYESPWNIKVWGKIGTGQDGQEKCSMTQKDCHSDVINFRRSRDRQDYGNIKWNIQQYQHIVRH